jgi:predicted thioesterase
MDLPLGASREEHLLVTGDVAISFLGLETARVLSTPHLIGYLELTARNLIQQYLPPGFDSVGTLVEFKHVAATPIGMHVRLRAEVVQVVEQRVTCRVEAWDDREKVGEGLHERFIIDVERFAARVQAKAAAH